MCGMPNESQLSNYWLRVNHIMWNPRTFWIKNSSFSIRACEHHMQSSPIPLFRHRMHVSYSIWRISMLFWGTGHTFNSSVDSPFVLLVLGLISPSHTFPHQRVNTLNNRRSVSANSELLQIKLRRLINDSSSPKDSVFDSYVQKARRPSFDLEHTKFEPPHQFSSPKRFNQEVQFLIWMCVFSNDGDEINVFG